MPDSLSRQKDKAGFFMNDPTRGPQQSPECNAVSTNGIGERSDCVFSLNSEWVFTYLNSMAETEVLPSEQLLGRHILEVFPQLVDTPFWSAYQDVMHHREPRHLEAFLPGLDHWYEVHAAPTQDGITVYFRNIDARRRTEDDLRDREAQFRKTLDLIPQMVWTTCARGKSNYYSRSCYEFVAIPEGSADKIAWADIFHPDDRQRAWALWRHSLQTGDPFEMEYRLRHHTGDYHWVLARARAETDADGAIVRWYGTCTDIHDRVMTQTALHDARSVRESVLNASADCIKIIRPNGTLEFMNGSGLRAMEVDCLDSIRGKCWPSLWPSEGQPAVRKALDSALSGRLSRFTGYCPTPSGKAKWWDVVITPMRDEVGEVTRLLSISRDVTLQRETTEQLQWASEHDALTDLPNRRAFSRHLQAATIRAMQHGGDVALLLVDLDHFKHINDTMGHPAGDHLLKAFAHRLRDTVRNTDFVARLGGDEFAILVEGARGTLDPVAIGTAIVERFNQPVWYEGRQIGAGASIGGAVFPRDANNANELFRNADIALYALKDGGRGGTQMFHGQMRERAQIVASQLSMARDTLSARSVEPHYQQKVDLRTGRIAGMEALLRWRHGTRGLQSPDTVAEAFKDYELAAKIGELMQRTVFTDLKRWLSMDLPVGFVAINAAPAEFLRDDFAEQLIARMADHAIPASLVEIEVTEHVFSGRGAEYVARALKRLDEVGVRIALDDFGTGHSSLAHLRDFPVDVVKIDRSFVEKMTEDMEVRAIVSAVIELSRSLKIEVVAEGVETAAQRRLLIDEGCQLGQGYFFGKPVEAAKIPGLLRNQPMRLVA
jgi:diguanylate cyclase (GGDEF)-like protein/PAS domain S-box-containing protein